MELEAAYEAAESGNESYRMRHAAHARGIGQVRDMLELMLKPKPSKSKR
jgi:hypothetical protein